MKNLQRIADLSFATMEKGCTAFIVGGLEDTTGPSSKSSRENTLVQDGNPANDDLTVYTHIDPKRNGTWYLQSMCTSYP